MFEEMLFVVRVRVDYELLVFCFDPLGFERDLQPKASSSSWKVSTASGNSEAVSVAASVAAAVVSARLSSGMWLATVWEVEGGVGGLPFNARSVVFFGGIITV